jgi:NAD(P)-dependent dehydrogenase (short-subunit alcohol dehydrogenase family)
MRAGKYAVPALSPEKGRRGMTSLDGRVAIITGAGRGLGREHALLFAREGAKVVVNDLGGASDGTGTDVGPAQQVVDEIKALGGQAVANTDSASSWDGAQRMLETAVDTFGDVHILINNAGILRDRVIVNMTEQDWDDVVDVHLKGHFCPTHWVARYWRDQSKAGKTVEAAIVNTSSGSGLFGNPGQLNYAAAKAGIAAMTLVAARELERYGVRVNAIAPLARTRLTEATPGLSERIEREAAKGEAFDRFDPANSSPLVAYLSSTACHLTGQVIRVFGGIVTLNQGWTGTETFRKDGRWDVRELQVAMKDVPAGPPKLGS